MQTPSAELIYKKNPDFIARKIAGEIVLIPLQRKIDDIKSIYNLNEMACDFWEQIDGRTSLEQIRRKLLGIYEVETATLDQDLQSFIEQLVEINAIQPA